jgi:acetylornithine deacetylase/succinyl-diaminopimelate desuccinylase-like protein
MNRRGIYERIDAEFEEHLHATQVFVRQPSISADGTGMPEMAQLVADHIERLGGTTELISTAGYPVVYGHIDAGASRSVLVYGMYDVQPVAEEKWLVPPFGGKIVDFQSFGKCLVSRGIMNSKGPLIGTINALDAIRKEEGTYPVNVKFIVEGEEELGSVHLPEAIEYAKQQLEADAVFFPFYSQDQTGKVVMYLGVKGLVFLDLVVQGGDWGGPTDRGVHGMHAGWFASPTWVLVQALASMLDRDQQKILIDDVYTDVAPPTEEDEELLSRLSETFDPQTQLRENDVVRFKYDFSGADLLREYLFQPSLNIDGIGSGHIAEGMKTVLPHEARAKIDIRLVPRMHPEDIISRVRQHLDRRGFEQVEIHSRRGYPFSKSSVSDLANNAMVQAYRSLGFEPEIWPLVSGSAPLYVFTQQLGIPCTIGGLGHGGRQHSPNEYATVDGIRLFEKSVVSLLDYLAGSDRTAGR